MARSKVWRQRPIRGGREALPSCVVEAVWDRVDAEARKFRVSRSWVIAKLLAIALDIDEAAEVEDYTKAHQRARTAPFLRKGRIAMSHVTEIKTKIRELEALDEACQALGLELQRGKTDWAWWGTFVGDPRRYGRHDPATFGRSVHAIKVQGTAPKNGPAGPWEIGVVPATDGDGFSLLYDNYGGAGRQLEAAAGKDLAALKREYSVIVATRKAKAKLRGFTLSRENLTGNRVRLRLRRA